MTDSIILGGLIRSKQPARDKLAALGCQAWIGRRWIDTVTSESRIKIQDMLQSQGASELMRWRHVNHPSPTGNEVALQYVVVPLGGGKLLAMGRDLESLAELQRRQLGAVQSPSAFDDRTLDRIHSPRYLNFLATAWDQWVALDAANADKDILPSVWPTRTFRTDIEPDNFAARMGLYSFDAGSPLTSGTWAAARAGAAARRRGSWNGSRRSCWRSPRWPPRGRARRRPAAFRRRPARRRPPGSSPTTASPRRSCSRRTGPAARPMGC